MCLGWVNFVIGRGGFGPVSRGRCLCGINALNHRLGNIVELGGGCNTSYLQEAVLGSKS